MHSYRIVWEDEAKAREIEVLVRYRLDAGVVTVNEIRPTQVTLYNVASKRRQPRACRFIPPGVVSCLAEAYLASRETEVSLEEEILAAHALLDDEIGAAV